MCSFSLSRRLTSRTGAAAVALAVAATLCFLYLSGARPVGELPALASFNIRGGLSLSPEFAALLTGLVTKFSALFAEIRAGGDPVRRYRPVGGGTSARPARLANHPSRRLAAGAQGITPLTTSSYLDLTKDSSLAVAIAFPDLGEHHQHDREHHSQSMEALIILIGIFLAINLSLSALMNAYNSRVALKGITR
ncbi:amino acid ABC transporter permease protein (plasmid) [Sinorhizobium americanum CCGM7]|nr:amino acid ABC transporter permease protein [Sinorhizobium americanum CCGM7]